MSYTLLRSDNVLIRSGDRPRIVHISAVVQIPSEFGLEMVKSLVTPPTIRRIEKVVKKNHAKANFLKRRKRVTSNAGA